MIRVITRTRSQHLVAGVEQSKRDGEERLLRPWRDHDLLGRVGGAAVCRDVFGNRLAQRQNALRVGVVRGALRQGVLASAHDVRGRVEVRVAAAHPDDVGQAVGDLLQAEVDAHVFQRGARGETDVRRHWIQSP